MSRDDGFAVMDVSTDIVNDPKFRKLQRFAPEYVGAAFTAYIATIAESWKAGSRVRVDDAWPAFLPFDPGAVQALIEVGLLDGKGMVPSKAWRGWFDAAKTRRDLARERWARANAKRHDDASQSPRGNGAATASPVPSVPSVRPSDSAGARDEFATRPRKLSTVDRDPLLREIRDAVRDVNGPGMDEPPVAPAGWRVKA